MAAVDSVLDPVMDTVKPHLANLDLNLLVALRELLRERNVTRAAERIGITQPAASAALSRLRRHFGDDLLLRSKAGYVLTPLARQLAEQVEAVCIAAERLFATSREFEPATTERQFQLLMADYTTAVMGRRLSALMDREAPRARLSVIPVTHTMVSGLADTVRLLDGVVAPPVRPFRIPGVRRTDLFRDQWVCIVSRQNRKLGTDAPEVDDLERLSWVVPYHRDPGAASTAPIQRQLSLLGIHPHVSVRVESYQSVPYFVAGTDRVALLQQRLAVRVATALDLRIVQCPGNPEPIVESLWWHENYADDPAHSWLRRIVERAADGV